MYPSLSFTSYGIGNLSSLRSSGRFIGGGAPNGDPTDRYRSLNSFCWYESNWRPRSGRLIESSILLPVRVTNFGVFSGACTELGVITLISGVLVKPHGCLGGA